MIKKVLFYINALWVGSYSYSLVAPTITQQPQKVPSLQVLSTKHLFLFNTQEEKEQLNRKLIIDPTFREQLKFDGLVIENLDLSDLCLKDINFSECVFESVNFNGSDLRGCKFDGCEFKNFNLDNAILYCSSDVAEEKVNTEGFKITDWNPLALMKLYSSLIKESKIKKEDHVANEALAKSRCLNKFFPGLKLNLYGRDLSNLDLTDINLENANLHYARLQNTRLSNEVEVPNYIKNDRNQLFNKWIEGKPEEQKAYQKLANDRFNLVLGVEPTQLIKGLKRRRTLEMLTYMGAHLQGADLQNADLCGAHLQGANLREAVISGVSLSNSFRLPLYCKDKDLMGIYQSYKDQQAKNLLRDILKAKDLWIE